MATSTIKRDTPAGIGAVTGEAFIHSMTNNGKSAVTLTGTATDQMYIVVSSAPYSNTANKSVSIIHTRNDPASVYETPILTDQQLLSPTLNGQTVTLTGIRDWSSVVVISCRDFTLGTTDRSSS